jgi:hypothetical protein
VFAAGRQEVQTGVVATILSINVRLTRRGIPKQKITSTPYKQQLNGKEFKTS